MTSTIPAKAKVYAEGLLMRNVRVEDLVPYHVQSDTTIMIYAENGIFTTRYPAFVRLVPKHGEIVRISDAWKHTSLLVDTSAFDEIIVQQFHPRHLAKYIEQRQYQWTAHDPITLVVEIDAIQGNLLDLYWRTREPIDTHTCDSLHAWLQFYHEHKCL